MLREHQRRQIGRIVAIVLFNNDSRERSLFEDLFFDLGEFAVCPPGDQDFYRCRRDADPSHCTRTRGRRAGPGPFR